MNIRKRYIDFKKHIYLNKLENLFSDYNFFESIEKKTNILFNDDTIKEIIKTENSYDLEFTRGIIKNFIENSILNNLYNKNITISNEIIQFILFNGIDKVFFDNIHIFKEDIDFLNKYENLLTKINQI